jgi:rhodanese-related sulfurtransferase
MKILYRRAVCIPGTFFLALFLPLPGPGFALADEPGTAVRSVGLQQSESSGGPYCGVYSLYGALRSLGIEIRFEDLLQTKYIGSESGSSLAELQQAARDFGAYAEPMGGLNAAALRVARHPIILHVRRPGKGTPFLHWVLFLGVDQDQARIVDPPNSVDVMSFAQLLSLWDGIGLVISKEPLEMGSVRWSSWLAQGAVLLLVAAALGVVHALRRLRKQALPSPAPGRIGSLVRPIRGSVMLLGVGCGLGILCDWLNPEGFFLNRTAVAQVVGRHFEPSLPLLSVAEVAAELRSQDSTIIDARLPADFEAGHLEGAINLPVFAGPIEREKLLASVNPAHRIVVYCQSDRCTWSHAVASDLVYRGFRNVAIFPGGWSEWRDYEQTNSGR